MIDRTIINRQRILPYTESIAIFNLFKETVKENQGDMSLALLAVYHAGRIEGIRQERKRRKKGVA